MTTPFGIRFSALRTDQLIGQLVAEEIPVTEPVRLVVTANLDHIVSLTKSAEFRAAYSRAWVATADGTPVYLYARLRGCPVPQRVAGSDLFASLLPRLSPHVHRPFFVVSRDSTGAVLEEYLRARDFPADAIAVESPPFGFHQDAAYSTRLAARIRAHGTTHLVLGVGAPKSEVWIDAHRHELGNCYALAVGAGVDFFAGVERRAPVWMQRIGMEWSWRVAREPRRLFRRYFIDSWAFVRAVRCDLIGAARDLV